MEPISALFANGIALAPIGADKTVVDGDGGTTSIEGDVVSLSACLTLGSLLVAGTFFTVVDVAGTAFEEVVVVARLALLAAWGFTIFEASLAVLQITGVAGIIMKICVIALHTSYAQGRRLVLIAHHALFNVAGLAAANIRIHVEAISTLLACWV